MSGGAYSVSVTGVIVDEDDRALLIQRKDNAHWEPPGGILEVDERITDGLRREVREETGLTVEPVGLTGVYKNMSRGIIALVFRCRATGGTLTVNPEVIAFHWASKEDVADMVTEAFAIRVQDAYHYGSPPAVREHDGLHLI
jgi:ADP-ribose pyrophosphatase YjhB (NUDIX family)